MRLAKQFNDVIQKQLNVFAAWMPLSNTFALGDYGLFDDGVFAKMGNISEFGVTMTTGTGQPATIDFTSASTQVVRFAAGVEVDVIPEGTVNAKVTYNFQDAQSLMVKSPTINVTTINNVNEIGTALMASPKWDNRFKVVYQLYDAQDVAIMSTIDAGTAVTFTGDVQALQALNVGNVDVGYQANKQLGLQLQGKDGTIGLGLFQITKGFLGLGKEKVQILGAAAPGEEELHIAFLNPAEVESDL